MIEINNLTTGLLNSERITGSEATGLIDEKFLKRVAEKILKGEKQEKQDLSIALVGQGRIRELNKKYRGKNRVTDVLAFGQNQKGTSSSQARAKRNKFLASESKKPTVRTQQKFTEPFLGEIVICLREVKKNTKRFDSTFKKELTRVLIHGILHLLGEDHEKGEKAAEAMEKKQNYYLLQVILEK